MRWGLGELRPPIESASVACIGELMTVPLEQFLKQRAVNVSVSGSYTLPRWYDPQGRPRKFACRTRRVSPFRMIVDVPVVGKVGDRLTSYFSEFGEFDGKISDTRQGSFLVELDMPRQRRVWMSEKLTWLEKKQKQRGIRDVRKDVRLVPQTSHTSLTLADGSMYPCFIIDVSTSGVAVSTEYQPPIGMPLAVGSCVGRVVRRFQHGFALKFVKKQDRINVLRLIVRTAGKQKPVAG
jgi:hypothetical protein